MFAIVGGVLLGTAGVYFVTPSDNDHATEIRLELLAKEIALSAVQSPDGKSFGSQDLASIPKALLAKDDPNKYQIWLRNGSLLSRSQNAPDSQPIIPLSFTGYNRIKFQGAYFTVYSAASPDGDVIVQIAEPAQGPMAPTATIAAKYLAFIGLSIGILLLAAFSLLRKTFRPLEHLAAKISTRSQADLKGPILENPPVEMLPILQSLDFLVSRISHARTVENNFTAVAAHELRTPLAGIRAQAQIASKARDQEELQEALDSVLIGVDKAKKVVEQLIDLAKVESTGDDIEWSKLPIRLSTIYEQVMEELTPVAVSRKVNLKVAFEGDHINGLDFAIYILLRNLIANAILYCPLGGSVNVQTQRQGDDVILTIDDTGPGIPVEARANAFEKFNRLGKNGPDGVGLGLSIVAQVAELHKAKIDLLTSPLGGLRAQVVFRRLP